VEWEVKGCFLISKPHACNRDSGMNLEFLFRCAHSRRGVECTYWSGRSLSLFTASSNEVPKGSIGPDSACLPNLGCPAYPSHHLARINFMLVLVNSVVPLP
jgi:hypothetical protein